MSTPPRLCTVDNEANRLARSKQLRILLIEDSEADAGLMAARLQHVNSAYSLDWVTTLFAGQHRLKAAHYDVVLLDLNLLDSTGLATFERLHETNRQVPVIVLTGLDDQELAAEAMRLGAEDFVPKAKADGETLDRAIRYARERARRRRAERELQHFTEEIVAARKIQHFLNPKTLPDLLGWDIAGECRPADAVGGDFFDIFSIEGGQLGLVVADVSGHGFGPALIMAETRCLVRALGRAHADPTEVLTFVNRALYEDTPDDTFVTLFMAILDTRTHSLAYCSAGHEAYLVKSAGHVTALSSTTGFPLGICEDAEFTRMKLGKLQPGDVLVLLTDGFQEAFGANDELFGIERALAVVQQVCNQSARQILDVLLDTVFAYCRPNIPRDDLTALIVKVNDTAHTQARATKCG